MNISTPVSESRTAPRGRRVSHAEFLRLWNDPTLTTADIGRILNIHQTAVCVRAKARGIPPRKGFYKNRIHDDAAFREMWEAGVLIEEMARHFNVFISTIRRTRTRFGLAPRPRGNSYRSITLEQFLHDRLARQMARTAMQEQAMMLDAGAIDRTQGFRAFMKDRREVRI